MVDVAAVAEEILYLKGELDTFRLQKLVYYAQAYHVAKHHGDPLFAGRIEAWVNGPVALDLYRVHRGSFKVTTVNGDRGCLTDDERTSIGMALRFYGAHDANWLVDQTHVERPWVEARVGLAPGERGSNQITIGALYAYFGPIFNDAEVEAVLGEAGDTSGLTAEELRTKYRL